MPDHRDPGMRRQPSVWTQAPGDREAARVSPGGLVALLGLVDDVDAALAAHEAVVAVAVAQDFSELRIFMGPFSVSAVVGSTGPQGQ
jgi:hypothetical protein